MSIIDELQKTMGLLSARTRIAFASSAALPMNFHACEHEGEKIIFAHPRAWRAIPLANSDGAKSDAVNALAYGLLGKFGGVPVVDCDDLNNREARRLRRIIAAKLMGVDPNSVPAVPGPGVS